MRRVLSVLAAVVFLAVTFVPAASAANPFYLLRNGNSLMCMSAEGGRMVNGTKVIQWPCNVASKDQGWYLSSGQFKNRQDPSFCLSAPNNWTSPGLQLIIWKCQGAPGQNWVPARSAEGAPLILNPISERIVAVGGSSRETGAAVVQWTWTGMSDQMWGFERYQEV